MFLLKAGNSVCECGRGQTPARLGRLQESRAWWSGVKEGRGGQKRRAGWGCYILNCCIRHTTRSTLVQETHITAGETKGNVLLWAACAVIRGRLSFRGRITHDRKCRSGPQQRNTRKTSLQRATWLSHSWSHVKTVNCHVWFPPQTVHSQLCSYSKTWGLTSCLRCSERQCWHVGNLLF